MRKLANTVAASAMVGWLVLLGACSDDFGTPCDFPQAPEIAEFCEGGSGDSENQSTATCIDPINPDCDTRLCVSFEGSSPFCSQRCSSDGGCPSDASCEDTLGSTIGVCVPNHLLR